MIHLLIAESHKGVYTHQIFKDARVCSSNFAVCCVDGVLVLSMWLLLSAIIAVSGSLY